MKPEVGPTGEFPLEGPINEIDKGGCYAGFRIIPEMRRVMLDFGTTVDWIAGGPEDTMLQVTMFREAIKEAFGDLSYEVTGLPFRIAANKEHNVVETDFGIKIGVLVANPELFLAWAQRLEEAVAILKPTS